MMTVKMTGELTVHPQALISSPSSTQIQTGRGSDKETWKQWTSLPNGYEIKVAVPLENSKTPMKLRRKKRHFRSDHHRKYKRWSSKTISFHVAVQLPTWKNTLSFSVRCFEERSKPQDNLPVVNHHFHHGWRYFFRKTSTISTKTLFISEENNCHIHRQTDRKIWTDQLNQWKNCPTEPRKNWIVQQPRHEHLQASHFKKV